MKEFPNVVSFKGKPLTLIGKRTIEVGDDAPDFVVHDNSLNSVNLNHFKGKKIVISSVPSLDTPVCDIETKKFNEIATKLDDNVVILTISLDTPFAQSRWCGNNGIKNVIVLSDYKDRDFGYNYGLYIKELGLLARAIFIVDENRKVKYKQIVKEVSNEPNYDEVLANL